MYKKMLGVLFTYFVLYLLNFFIVPYACEVFTGFYYDGTTANLISYVVTFSVFFIGMWFITDALIALLSCFSFYILLLFLYIPVGLYGLGMRMSDFFQYNYDFKVVSVHIMILAAVELFIVLAPWIFVKIGKTIIC